MLKNERIFAERCVNIFANPLCGTLQFFIGLQKAFDPTKVSIAVAIK